MGRSFEGVRVGVKDVSARWLKARQALKNEDQKISNKDSKAFYRYVPNRYSVG